MIKVWNPDDTSLFSARTYRFTEEGLRKYWLSIDAAIKFWDTILCDKFQKKSTKQQQQVEGRCTSTGKSNDNHQSTSTKSDRYHWHQ